MPEKKETEQDHQDGIKSIDDYLDEALQETFPASDPVAISRPDKKEPLKKGKKPDHQG